MTQTPELQSSNPYIVEKDLIKKEETIQKFFTDLKKVVPINKIYYPGPGMDRSLNGVFEKEQITYVDRDPKFEGIVRAKYEETGLPSEEFDALFLQDTHLQRHQMPELLRVLKKNGIAVASLYGCGFDNPALMGPKDYSVHPQLSEIHPLPQWENIFKTYTKVA